MSDSPRPGGGEEAKNGSNRADYGGKRQRTEGHPTSSSSSSYDALHPSSSSSSASPFPSSSSSSPPSRPPPLPRPPSPASWIPCRTTSPRSVEQCRGVWASTAKMPRRSRSLTRGCSVVASLQIPDEVVSSILRTTGCDVSDTKLLRLIALSAQRFIFSVAEDAQQLSRLRSRQATDAEVKSSELTMEDLTVALSYQGIQVNKPPYYADHLDSSH